MYRSDVWLLLRAVVGFAARSDWLQKLASTIASILARRRQPIWMLLASSRIRTSARKAFSFPDQ
jgi:hypothetical protein